MTAPDQHPRALKRATMRSEAERPAAAALAREPEHDCTPTKIKKTGSNGDETKYPDKRGNYHKGLPHDGFGIVKPAAYASMLKALQTRTGFDKIILDPDGGRKLTNPQAALAGDLEGPCPRDQKMLAAPSVTSIETSTEAVELYWMALLRDVPFVEWGTNGGIGDAIDELNKQKEYTGPTIGGKITRQTVFRGCDPGDTAGPYLSQFLLHDIGYGSLTINQRQMTVLGEPALGVGKADYLTDYATWLAVQNGSTGPFNDQIDPKARYIRDMRDLGQYVHVDALYEAYLNACLILLDTGAKLDPGNPYESPHPDFKTQIGFGTFGGPHILSLVTEVATRALKAQWYQKWVVNRRLRPEAYGGLVHLTLVGHNGTKRDFGLPKPILQSVAVKRTLAKSKGKSALMPMAFPEGSPTHPSYGAGHATVAGACVTILKAWFKEDELLMLKPMVPRADGLELDPYTGSDANKLTVEGELNKVAANISIGRNMAGVHWRSDYTESVRLGEEVALCILSNQRFDYNECGWSFTLRRFNGQRVTVNSRGVFDEKGKKVRLSCEPCKARPVCK
ncbi:MAG TPA: vanadium-dependent haloperoxidase [Thermoanaerobaculia bacterium]|nr:vanadium-dependent haloperoxidase [Thermoanaerobaculia bacterium]